MDPWPCVTFPTSDGCWAPSNFHNHGNTFVWSVAGAGVGGTPRGRSSLCEHRGSGPTLTSQKCLSPAVWVRIPPGSMNEHTHSALTPPPPPAPAPFGICLNRCFLKDASIASATHTSCPGCFSTSPAQPGGAGPGQGGNIYTSVLLATLGGPRDGRTGVEGRGGWEAPPRVIRAQA